MSSHFQRSFPDPNWAKYDTIQIQYKQGTEMGKKDEKSGTNGI